VTVVEDVGEEGGAAYLHGGQSSDPSRHRLAPSGKNLPDARSEDIVGDECGDDVQGGGGLPEVGADEGVDKVTEEVVRRRLVRSG
jgi:hypothetical protein